MDIDDLARLLPFIIVIVLWLSKFLRKKEKPAGAPRRSRDRRSPRRRSPAPHQEPEFKRAYEPIEPR